MHEILFHYRKVDPATWVYLSSLLTIGLYFKFSRLWSVRNLDLLCLILFAPPLLMVEHGLVHVSRGIEQLGYVWLFVVGGLFLLRLLLDPMMVRRPLLEPNLSLGGMTFIGAALLIFLMANVVNSGLNREEPVAKTPSPVAAAEPPPSEAAKARAAQGTRLLHLPPLVARAFLTRHAAEDGKQNELIYTIVARTSAIVAHIGLVVGMVLIGYRHFDNVKTGVGAALLYLLLPYTAQRTGWVDHVLAGALLVWAVELYRRPLLAGVFLGLAIGCVYYPLFLLPLWLGFYWQRGMLRFAGGVALALVALVGGLALVADGSAEFWVLLRQMLGWSNLSLKGGAEGVFGFWDYQGIDAVYRIPVLAAFFALSCSLALWPAQKNLGTLISCSAAVMLGTQFWVANGGGLCMAWYLPLLLLTIFRPNLEDRVALSVLGEGWLARRRAAQLAGAERAA